MSVIQDLGSAAVLLGRMVRSLRSERLPVQATLRQLNDLGVRSLWLVGSGMIFFGAVMVTIAELQARRFVGNLALVGPPYFQLLVREFGPITTALLIAARLGAACAAELSTMSVTEQVEALELSAGDPFVDLVAPRVFASTLMVPALSIVGTALAALSAAAVSTLVYGIDGRAFLDPRYVTVGDIACSLIKSALCGAIIPLFAASQGLSARGGAAAVGDATTRGVVAASLGCMVVDLAVGLAFQRLGL